MPRILKSLRMLHPGPEFVVRAYLNAWTSQDVEHALSYMSDDVAWHMYLGEDVVAFAGYSVGVDAMRQRMEDLRKHFQLLSFSFDHVSFVGQTVRTMMYADYRHIRTGRVLDLKMRGVFTVVGNRIARCDEFHDEARVRAFMALVNAEAGGSP